MESMSRDNQGCLLYIETGGPSNLSSKLDKDKEVSPQEQQNLLLEKIFGMTTKKGETFHSYLE